MSEYESLEKLFHMDASASRFSNNNRLAMERLNADSSFRTGFITPKGELFLAVPRELTVLHDAVMRLERKVSQAMKALPPIACGSLIRSLVFDEVVFSNDLENIHSTRRQIQEAVDYISSSGNNVEHRRFREFALLYLGLSQDQVDYPQTAEDIRAIYDRVMTGEQLAESAPDGKLFRRDKVQVIGRGGKVLHEGMYPEQAIIDAMNQMLALSECNEIPDIYSAILSHYIFEYAHPFYDGNGRTGRYLLSLYLSQPLSTLTALSVSRTIHEHKDAYYRSFKEAQAPRNHGELTHFTINMLSNVYDAQNRLVDSLAAKRKQLEVVTVKIQTLAKDSGLTDHQRDILYALAQVALFAEGSTMPLEEVAALVDLSTQQTRRHLSSLESMGVVELASKRPLRFKISDGLLGCWDYL